MTPQAVPRPKPPAKATLPQLHPGESYAVVARGWIGKLGNAHNAAVFVALCLHANHTTGQAWPSMATICGLCYDVNKDTVRRSLRALERLGAITLIEQGKGRTPTRYQINQSPPP
ncbi:MAG: helix-turn-helix domain-containing protein [Candidatus Tumulicola sp.]